MLGGRRAWPAATAGVAEAWRLGSDRLAMLRHCRVPPVAKAPMLLGYAPISTQDQNHASQRDALSEACCERLIEETAGGGVPPPA